jgi:hypothetical protein
MFYLIMTWLPEYFQVTGNTGWKIRYLTPILHISGTDRCKIGVRYLIFWPVSGYICLPDYTWFDLT